MIQLQACSRPQLARSHHDFNIPLPYCQTEKYWLLVASTVLVRQGGPPRPPNCTIPVLEALKQVAVWQPHALGTRRHFCQMEQYSLPEVLQMLRLHFCSHNVLEFKRKSMRKTRQVVSRSELRLRIKGASYESYKNCVILRLR